MARLFVLPAVIPCKYIDRCRCRAWTLHRRLYWGMITSQRLYDAALRYQHVETELLEG